MQFSIRDHTMAAALHPAHCASQADRSCTLAHDSFTKLALCHWSSDPTSTNITAAQSRYFVTVERSQILNAPPLMYHHGPAALFNIPSPHHLDYHTRPNISVLTPFMQSQPQIYFPVRFCFSCEKSLVHHRPLAFRVERIPLDFHE